MTYNPTQAATLHRERLRIDIEAMSLALVEINARAASIQRKIQSARQAMAQAQHELSQARGVRP